MSGQTTSKKSFTEGIVGEAEKDFGDMGGYWLGTVGSAAPEVKRAADEYKLGFLKKMIALEAEDISPRRRKKKLPDDLVVAVKRDGEYNVLFYDGAASKSFFCNSPNARVRYNLPVNREIEANMEKRYSTASPELDKALEKLGKGGARGKISELIVAGELFANIRKEGDRPRAFDFITLSRSPKGIEDLELVHFDVFDLISINDTDMLDLPYEQRLELAGILFPRDADNKAKIVEHEKGVKGSAVYDHFERWAERENHEGIVVNTKYHTSYKIKKVHEIDAVIVGFAEMLEEKKVKGEDSISTVLTALMRVDGTFQTLAKVGGGFTEEQRIDLYKLLSADMVESSYRATKSDGRAFRMVEPKYVIQIKYTDIVVEGANNRPIYREAIAFEDGKWSMVRSLPFVSLISPRMDTMRSIVDSSEYPSLTYENPKEVRYEDTKIDQILDLVAVETPKTVGEAAELPNSEILLRVAYDGEWPQNSGNMSGKKIMLWKTNKDHLDDSFPKYVVYLGDYKHSRRDPLKQLIYDFNSLEKAIDQINFLYHRPDNESEALLGKNGKLKKSLKFPPRSITIDESARDALESGLLGEVEACLWTKTSIRC